MNQHLKHPLYQVEPTSTCDNCAMDSAMLGKGKETGWLLCLAFRS